MSQPNILPASFFITGTDTEIGKTLVAGALILKLKEINQRVIGFKPVVAGTYIDSHGKKCNEDLETLRMVSGKDAENHTICPYVLDIPAAPHIQADKQGMRLDCAVILDALETLKTEFDSVVVEGAGGFLVPLNEHEDLGDLAQAMDLPVILVVGMRLGCINHALLTCEAIQSRQLSIAGWVANTPTEEMPFFEENLKTLQNRIFAPFLGTIPHLPAHLQKSVDAAYSMDALLFAARHIRLPE